jgi:hypothetical protein
MFAKTRKAANRRPDAKNKKFKRSCHQQHCYTGKLKQLVKSMDEKPKAPKGLVDAIRATRQQYKITSK